MKLISLLIILLTITSCSNKHQDLTPADTHFPQGVASGDPLADRVIIWTRINPSETKSGNSIAWEVAEDSLFQKIANRGDETIAEARDFTIKADVRGLEPDKTYYYRFLDQKYTSPTGRTKTLPLNPKSVKLAFVNCSKFEGGYFNGFNALVKEQFADVDAIIHLGDYIYEGVLDTLKTPPNHGYMRAYELTGRMHEPRKEIISLSDYRQRFQQYREDPDLQELHRLFPMINIWDDHEFANDSWSTGAKNHQPENEGDWESRKQNAIKAYFEWIPIRGQEQKPIYRQFKFGELVNLMMLDTRMCCRTPISKDFKSAQEVYDQATMIGLDQLEWIKSRVLLGTNVTWNVLGNQVLFSRWIGVDGKEQFKKDEWSGYPRERNLLKTFFTENQHKNFVIFTGNHHWAKQWAILEDEDNFAGDTVAWEFMPGSISSGNFGEKGDISQYHSLKKSLIENYPQLSWFDLTKHGFIVAEFTSQSAVVDFYVTSTIWSKDYKLSKIHSVKLDRK